MTASPPTASPPAASPPAAGPPTAGHPSVEEVARLVLTLPGVRGASAVRRRRRDPLVRLRLAAGVDPAQTCRDVVTLVGAAPPPHAEPEEGGTPMTTSPSRPHPSADRQDVVAPDAAGTPGAGTRVHLRRVRVTTEGTTTVAEVVLTRGEVVHTGIADAAATPAGAHRALAGATTRCLESAAGGRARLEVDGVQVDVVAGQPTAVVCLSIVTERGHEQISGSALVLGDPHRAVVRAVLAAANRRISLTTADHDGA